MGVIVLDAGVVIGLLDANDPHHATVRQSLERARAAGDRFVLPASAYAEVLAGPIRHDPSSADLVDAFVDALPATIAAADREIARAAATLRARHGRLRLPDALVVATAIVLEADLVITTDAGWPSLEKVVEVLRPSIQADLPLDQS